MGGINDAAGIALFFAQKRRPAPDCHAVLTQARDRRAMRARAVEESDGRSKPHCRRAWCHRIVAPSISFIESARPEARKNEARMIGQLLFR